MPILENQKAKTASKVFWVLVNMLWVALPIYAFYLLLSAPDDIELQKMDAFAIASQIGRLDMVSLALTFVGVGVGFFALFSYFQLKQESYDAVEKAAAAIQINLDEKVIELCEAEFDRRFSATVSSETGDFPTEGATETEGEGL